MWRGACTAPPRRERSREIAPESHSALISVSVQYLVPVCRHLMRTPLSVNETWNSTGTGTSSGMALLLCSAALALARPAVHRGLSSIADNYDAVLLDQFGVLHDGSKAIEGAIDCYEKLAAAGKKLIVLSNTSRRRAFALQKLPKLGFDSDALTGFVTSGEAAWQHLHASCAGKKVLWLSWDEDFGAWDPTYLDGLDVSLASAGECDLILCQGVGRLRDGTDNPPATDLLRSGLLGGAVEEALVTCVARGVPMVCANPDLYVTLPDGEQGHSESCAFQHWAASHIDCSCRRRRLIQHMRLPLHLPFLIPCALALAHSAWFVGEGVCRARWRGNLLWQALPAWICGLPRAALGRCRS